MMFITNRNLKIFLLICLMIISAFLNVGCNELNNDPSLTLFKNVNIIPMNTETILEGYNVVIKDGNIVKIGKPWKTRAPKNSIVIDGKGKYLVPGLTDMHVHLWLEDELILYLANGVTTVRDMFGNSSKLLLRGKIEQEEVLGPRLYIASPIIDGKPPIWPDSTVITMPEHAELWVSRYKKMDYDFIKIYERLTEEVYDSIIAAAKKEDIPVVGHIPDSVNIEKALQSGQRSIEHLDNYIDSDKLYDITIENNIWNCPTIVVYEMFNRALDKEELEGIDYVHPMWIKIWEERLDYPEEEIEVYRVAYQSKIDKNKIIAKKLYDKGGRILLGTDANNPFIIPGFSIHDELYNLVKAGLTPYEAIKTGTYDAAEFLNVLDASGTVEVGKNADLILLDENPLEDISNMKKIEGVMVRGKWISKNEIDEMLKTIAENVK